MWPFVFASGWNAGGVGPFCKVLRKEEGGTAVIKLAQAVTRAERAEAKTDEVERWAGDLRAELDRTHQDTDQARVAYQEQQKTSDKYLAELSILRSWKRRGMPPPRLSQKIGNWTQTWPEQWHVRKV